MLQHFNPKRKPAYYYCTGRYDGAGIVPIRPIVFPVYQATGRPTSGQELKLELVEAFLLGSGAGAGFACASSQFLAVA